MVTYTCKRCGYSTKIKTHFRNHIFRKFTCKSEVGAVDILSIQKDFLSEGEYSYCKFVCINCQRFFTRYSNLKRHEKSRCKSKDTSTKHCNMILNNNMFSHNTNNITNNFNLSVYGKEDYSYIAQDFFLSLQSNPYEGIPKLVGLIHFNPKHPENNNVKWVNINKNSIQRYENKGWTSYEKKDVIRDLNDQAYFAVDSEYDPNTTELNDVQKSFYEKFREEYDNGNERTIKRLEKQTERMILDERQKSKKN